MNVRSRFGLYLGRWFGIRFFLDYSWFLIAAILTYELAFGFFKGYLPGLTSGYYIFLGAISALIYFLSILLHELGHSLVSQRCGIPVPRITLLFIGGIAEISREPDTAIAELKIAAGGPVVSILLAILYGAGGLLMARAGWYPPALILKWLAAVNVLLVVFNCIPGYPLDGGRILRALIWARTGNLRKATFITTRIGVGFSWVLFALGMIFLFQGIILSGFVFFIIGIFLKNAAESGYVNVLYHEVLAGVRVADIMTRDPVCIPGYTPLSIVVDEFILEKNHVAYPVIGDDRDFCGMLHVEQLKALPRDKWAWTTAAEIASPNATIDGAQSAESATRRLLAAGEGRLAVVEKGKVVGVITRHDVLRFIKIHTELGEEKL